MNHPRVTALKIFLRTAFLVAILLTVSGCTVSARSKELSANQKAATTSSGVEVDLFTAKAFLGGSDYERYHLKDGVVWRECGQVDSKRKRAAQRIEGDEVLGPDPNLVVRERRVENLTSLAESSLREVATSFLADAARAQRKPPLPGSVFSVTEPGMFELAVIVDGQNHRLVTSVDAISDDDKRAITVVLSSAYKLFEKIRGIGPVMCEAETFFGIGRGAL